MRVAVVGAGGVGGGYGAALAHAGADVTFIARGAHLAAMKSTGLKVESPRGDTHLVPTQATDDPATVEGVNDRVQLARSEAELRRRTARRWLQQGVTMLDPERTAIDAAVQLAPDVTLFPGTLLQGRTTVGRGAEIGPDTRLVDCTVGPDAVVQNTVGTDASMAPTAA